MVTEISENACTIVDETARNTKVTFSSSVLSKHRHLAVVIVVVAVVAAATAATELLRAH